MESTTEIEAAQTMTVPCTAPPVAKPMQLSSTSSNIVMQSFVKAVPHVTTIVLPVAPPVMQAVNPPRIAMLRTLHVFIVYFVTIVLSG